MYIGGTSIVSLNSGPAHPLSPTMYDSHLSILGLTESLGPLSQVH